jgi:hypothetical protein
LALDACTGQTLWRSLSSEELDRTLFHHDKDPAPLPVVATPRGSTMWPVIDPSDPNSNKRRNRHIETMQARPQKLHAGTPPFIAHVGSATVEDVSAAVLHFDHKSGHKDHRAVSHRTNSKKVSSQRRPPRSHSPSKLKRAQQQSRWLPSQQASSDALFVISGPVVPMSWSRTTKMASKCAPSAMVGHCAICHCKIALSTPMSITTARSIVCMSSRAVVATDSISLERTTPCTSGSRIWRVAQPRSMVTTRKLPATPSKPFRKNCCRPHCVTLWPCLECPVEKNSFFSQHVRASTNSRLNVETARQSEFFRGTALVGGGQARPRCDGCGHYGCDCALSRGQWTASVAMGS